MKKLLYYIPVMALALMSCGGGENTPEGEATTENAEAEMKGVSADLSEYGMDLTITLPEKPNLQTEIMANDWGGIEIRQGDHFMMTIAYGEGDLDLMKFDLNEDLVYKSEILDESADHLLYKRVIEGADLEAEHHFVYVFRAGNEVIEIQNSKDATFTEEDARAMLQSARTVKAKSAS